MASEVEIIIKNYVTESVHPSHVTFRVGNAQKYEQYAAPRNLFQTSAMIKRRIERWEEDKLGPALVCLHWSSHTMFAHYLHWLEHCKVLDVTKHASNGSKANLSSLIAQYCFGVHIENEIYQDVIISTIIDKLAALTQEEKTRFIGYLHPGIVTAVYRDTTHDSPIRKLIVYAMTRIPTETEWIYLKNCQGWPYQFLADLTRSTGQALVKSKNQEPQSQLRLSNTGTVATTGRKAVRFWDTGLPLTFQKTSAKETECTYHHHIKSGNPCWRKQEKYCG